MSISLKSLYDQVQNIKLSGLSIIDSGYKLEDGHDKWFIKYSNGLIIQYGITKLISESYANTPIKFLAPFTNNNIVILASSLIKSDSYSIVDNSAQPFRIKSTSFNLFANHVGGVNGSMSYAWLAIGYLVSNRIKGWVM